MAGHAFTPLGDFYKPEIQSDFIMQQPLTSAALFAAGVIVRDPMIKVQGNTTNATPFLGGLSGAQRIIEGTQIDAEAFDAGACIAPVQTDMIVKGIGDLTMRAAGMTDPVRAFAQPFADAWPAEFQNRAILALKALSGAASFTAANLLDISSGSGAAGMLTAATAVDAAQKLGDRSGTLAAIVMHSDVAAVLTKAGIVTAQTIASAQGQEVYRNGTIYLMNGREVIIDDRCPLTGGVYTSFFLGKGAFRFNEEPLAANVAFEMERHATASTSIVMSRRFYVLHPAGVSYGGATPVTDAAYNASASWVLKWNYKAVPIVAVKHKNVSSG